MNDSAHHRHGASEFDVERVRGLPGPLPAGEQLLWQGSPDWRSLAVGAFHVRKIAIYFGAMLAWRVASGLADGQPLSDCLVAAGPLLVLAMAAVGVLTFLAWLAGRAAVYSITSRRVVMRIGAALPMTINIPFRTIEAAAVRLYRDGRGDIPLRIAPPDRIAVLVLWPHCRPWRVARPEPMLRSIPNAEAVAQTLASAMAAPVGAPTVATAAPERQTGMAEALSPAAA